MSRPAIQNRRREIEQRLAACGLARGPRRVFRGEDRVDAEEARGRKLRAALEDLGPIFSSFGLYLSARADLWPARDCLELAKISDRTVATPTHSVRSLLSREIDCSPGETFNAFEPAPFE